MKLKTLNDFMVDINDMGKYFNKEFKKKGIIPEDYEFKMIPNEEQTITIKQLRQEAIKHINHLQKISDKDCIEDISNGVCYPEDRCSNCTEAEEADNQIYWIKYFFNIRS